jgi:ribulose-phosphate 3-epimerase
MVESPDNLLPAFADAGASILSVHVETCPNLHRTLHFIHELGCKAGVVLKPATAVDLNRPILPLVDLVLVLSVNPGFFGQTFLPEVLLKITKIKLELDKMDHPVWLEVDGGINPDTLPLALEAGANVFVAATSIFKHPEGIAAGILQLRSTLPI